MKPFLLAWFLWPVALWAGELDELFDASGSVWTRSPESFMQNHAGLGFQWVSVNRDTARAARPGLTFLDIPVYEALARFEKSTVKEIVISLYNRGDAGELTEAEFQKLTEWADNQLTGWSGAKGVAFKVQDRTATAAIRRKSWIKEPHRVDLVWSYSDKSRRQGVAMPLPEYARLQITRFDPAHDPRKSVLADGKAGPPKPISALELKNRVKRTPSGDIVIANIPMVDQGQKGYCAAAVTERLLRYYGRSLDQHEIAQLARTSAASGTNPDQMVAALRQIGDETKMDVTVLQDFDVREFEKTVADYNRAAKHAKKPTVEFMIRDGDAITIISPADAYHEMETDLLREVRVKRDGSMQQFKASITKYINNGAPLAWGCIVGKVPEKPETKGLGGHMRLIIGYNDQTREVLYSDTWGNGHELKRLPLPDAWMITLGLYSVQPRDVRF